MSWTTLITADKVHTVGEEIKSRNVCPNKRLFGGNEQLEKSKHEIARSMKSLQMHLFEFPQFRFVCIDFGVNVGAAGLVSIVIKLCSVSLSVRMPVHLSFRCPPP